MLTSAAAVPDSWPGGVDLYRRPQPLLYSLWVTRHTPPGAVAAAAGGAAVAPPKVPSPFPRLPSLKSAPSWQRRALLLQKLRLASVVFDGLDSARFVEDREVKRNTLLEIVDWVDGGGRAAFAGPRLLDDTFTCIRLNLFRALPRAPTPSGDPDVEEEVFTDPQWAHLNIVYELLLRLVSLDHVDIAAKKRVLDTDFVRQLLVLFNSEDPRERWVDVPRLASTCNPPRSARAAHRQCFIPRAPQRLFENDRASIVLQADAAARADTARSHERVPGIRV